MTQQLSIILQQSVWPHNGLQMTFKLSADGIAVNPVPSEPDREPNFLAWESTTDVAQLAQDFRGLRVFEFEALCKGLAAAQAMKAVVSVVEPMSGFTEAEVDKMMGITPAQLTAAAVADANRAYLDRALPRFARLNELASKCAFDKMPAERTPEEQAAWNEHERIMAEQLADERSMGL